MVAYSAGRSCTSPYEGVTTVDDVIERMKAQLEEFQRMKEAGIEKAHFDGEEVFVFSSDPQTAARFDLKEDPYVEFDDSGALTSISAYYEEMDDC